MFRLTGDGHAFLGFKQRTQPLAHDGVIINQEDCYFGHNRVSTFNSVQVQILEP
jgi:hypothetical protein